MRDLKTIDWWNQMNLEEQTFKTYKVLGFDIFAHRLTDQQITEVYNFYN